MILYNYISKIQSKRRQTVALCKFSGMYDRKTPVVLDSAFITEYLPVAESDAVKVYLLGLQLCTTKDDSKNNIESMAETLGFSEERVVYAFEYWQNLGLVQIIAKDPLEVRFLSVDANAGNLKKYKTDKYHDFNVMLQSILCGREVLPNEFNEYYYFLESRHFEPEAFLCVVKYCTTLKGEKVKYPYILAVARSFAEDGITTEKAVNEKLTELESVSGELKQILKNLGILREADPDERKLYIKWTKAFGFEPSVIMFVAKNLKGQGVAKLDATLLKYYQSKLLSIPEIENYTSSAEENMLLAKEITRTIGVYYQNLDNVIETYIAEWQRMGFSKETLLQIANDCFRKSIRTLEGMHGVVQKFYKLGLVSNDAIAQYTSSVAGVDKQIAEILEVCGLVRGVNSWDRDFYRTWTYSWDLSNDIILEAAKVAKNKQQPMAYLNKILSEIYNAKATNLADAKQYLTKAGANGATEKPQMLSHTYTNEELSALFDNLDDIEV